ncbi:hypothetical protein LINPERHAP2_LOCUS31591 [Linum perenne]
MIKSSLEKPENIGSYAKSTAIASAG